MEVTWISRGDFEELPAALIYPWLMIYTFGDFELDLARSELRRQGQALGVEPQVFALISFLIERRDRLVSRDEILESLWQGRVVSDSALASRIKSARQALGDDGKTQRVIRTIHGKGLRFVADVNLAATVGVTGGALASRSKAKADGPDIAGLDKRPSIAVLPFSLIGGSDEWNSVAEGLPHELITELARLRWLFVVARTSSFRLLPEDSDPRRARQLLGVSYCLSGIVEVVARRLTVAVELVATADGDIVWAERYAGALDDVHVIREQIAASILSQLEIHIPMHEATRARLAVPDDLDAWSAYHLALQHVYRFTSEDNEEAGRLFQRAVRLEPGFARAYAGLSFVHFQTAFLQEARDRPGEITSARRYAERAVDLDPLDPFVNFAMGRTFWLESDLDRAYRWLERATSLCPNYAHGQYAKAWTESMQGAAHTARSNLDLSMRLSPLDPMLYAMLAARGLTHLTLGEDEEAAEWADRGASAPGAHALIAMIAASASHLAGRNDAAQSWAEEVRRRSPDLRTDDFFRAFPIRNSNQRKRMGLALDSLGFRTDS
ncbi:MAG: winged helix-turn-helix domain-containing protein [Pseudomonadota bacterium]